MGGPSVRGNFFEKIRLNGDIEPNALVSLASSSLSGSLPQLDNDETNVVGSGIFEIADKSGFSNNGCLVSFNKKRPIRHKVKNTIFFLALLSIAIIFILVRKRELLKRVMTSVLKLIKQIIFA